MKTNIETLVTRVSELYAQYEAQRAEQDYAGAAETLKEMKIVEQAITKR